MVKEVRGFKVENKRRDAPNNYRRLKREKGSITLEAVIVISVLIVVAFLLFGLFHSRSIDQTIQWKMTEVADEVALLPVESSENHLLADPLLRARLAQKLKDEGVQNSVKIKTTFKSKMMEGDALLWVVHYEYTFLSPLKGNQWAIPVKLNGGGDDIDYEDEIVFVTKYGEKYHRAGCRYLWNSQFIRSRQWAEETQYDPCKVCFDGEHKEGN